MWKFSNSYVYFWVQGGILKSKHNNLITFDSCQRGVAIGKPIS